MNSDTNKNTSNLSRPRETGSIIYNVTIKVEQSIADTWLEWLLNEHIPSIMQTNCFVEFKLVRLLEVDDSEGPTYAVQFLATSKADYNRYIELHSLRMQKNAFEKWDQQFITFSSVMEVVK